MSTVFNFCINSMEKSFNSRKSSNVSQHYSMSVFSFSIVITYCESELWPKSSPGLNWWIFFTNFGSFLFFWKNKTDDNSGDEKIVENGKCMFCNEFLVKLVIEPQNL